MYTHVHEVHVYHPHYTTIHNATTDLLGGASSCGEGEGRGGGVGEGTVGVASTVEAGQVS